MLESIMQRISQTNTTRSSWQLNKLTIIRLFFRPTIWKVKYWLPRNTSSSIVYKQYWSLKNLLKSIKGKKFTGSFNIQRTNYSRRTGIIFHFIYLTWESSELSTYPPTPGTWAMDSKFQIPKNQQLASECLSCQRPRVRQWSPKISHKERVSPSISMEYCMNSFSKKSVIAWCSDRAFPQQQ